MLVVGPSGSGKTTLINVLGCLDNPTSGKLSLEGRVVFENCKGLSEAKLTLIRRDVFGYIFQKFYLIPTLTVRENVILPFTFFKKPGAEEDVGRVLKRLGLDKRADHLPGQLSGGEMQRWPSPGPWSTSPTSCSRTSRPAISTPPGARRSA